MNSENIIKKSVKIFENIQVEFFEKCSEIVREVFSPGYEKKRLVVKLDWWNLKALSKNWKNIFIKEPGYKMTI